MSVWFDSLKRYEIIKIHCPSILNRVMVDHLLTRVWRVITNEPIRSFLLLMLATKMGKDFTSREKQRFERVVLLSEAWLHWWRGRGVNGSLTRFPGMMWRCTGIGTSTNCGNSATQKENVCLCLESSCLCLTKMWQIKLYISKPSLCQLAVFENATEYRRTSVEKKVKPRQWNWCGIYSSWQK